MRLARNAAFLMFIASVLTAGQARVFAEGEFAIWESANSCDVSLWDYCPGWETYTSYAADCASPGTFFCDDHEAACADFCGGSSAVESESCDDWGLTDCRCVPLLGC